jgi:hypothetical protein
MKVELGSVFAERRLRASGRPELDVRVRLGTPRPLPDAPHGDYYCPYQVIGLGNEKVRYAGAVDAIQALELAIHILPHGTRCPTAAASGARLGKRTRR